MVVRESVGREDGPIQAYTLSSSLVVQNYVAYFHDYSTLALGDSDSTDVQNIPLFLRTLLRVEAARGSLLMK